MLEKERSKEKDLGQKDFPLLFSLRLKYFFMEKIDIKHVAYHKQRLKHVFDSSYIKSSCRISVNRQITPCCFVGNARIELSKHPGHKNEGRKVNEWDIFFPYFSFFLIKYFLL